MKKRKQRTNPATQVPSAVQVQLARLFGSDSSEAKMKTRSAAQWKHTLGSVLAELYRYLEANIETDDVHWRMLRSRLAKAYDCLKEKDFWAGYAEGITRLALILMGEYPDHRRRKGGRKQEDHYRLTRSRSIQYVQTPTQKLLTLQLAPELGINLSEDVFDALREFRKHAGYKVGLKEFFKWYREKYPLDYAKVF